MLRDEHGVTDRTWWSFVGGKTMRSATSCCDFLFFLLWCSTRLMAIGQSFASQVLYCSSLVFLLCAGLPKSQTLNLGNCWRLQAWLTHRMSQWTDTHTTWAHGQTNDCDNTQSATSSCTHAFLMHSLLLCVILLAWLSFDVWNSWTHARYWGAHIALHGDAWTSDCIA